MAGTLAYLTYGNKEEYQAEARFSIASALFRSGDRLRPGFDVVVVTDTPEAFADLPVRVKQISADTIEEWFGGIHFHHRCKPKALEAILEESESVVLVDTDTVFLKDPGEIFRAIKPKRLIVDALEVHYGNPGDLYQETCGELLETKYGVDSSLRYVNSGVIGIDHRDRRVIKKTVELIDELYLKSRKVFHVEQFSLAVAAFSEGFEVISQDGVLHHYWSRKYIHRAIAKAFLRTHPDLLSEQSRIDFLALEFRFPKPPGIVRLWYKILARFVPDRRQLRQFYIELRRAMYPYEGLYHAVRADMAIKAYLNLKERNPDLYGEILGHGVESVISARLFPKGVLEEIAAAVRDSKDLDWGAKRETVESPDSSGD